MVRGNGIHPSLGAGLCPTVRGPIPLSGTPSHRLRGPGTAPCARFAGPVSFPGAVPGSAPLRARSLQNHPTPRGGGRRGLSRPSARGYRPAPALSCRPPSAAPASSAPPWRPRRHRGNAETSARSRQRLRPGRAEPSAALPVRPRARAPSGPFPSPVPPPPGSRLPSAPPGTAPRICGGHSCRRGCGCCGLRRLARQVWWPARGLWFVGVQVQPAETAWRALERAWAPRTLAGFWWGILLYLIESITVLRGLFLVKNDLKTETFQRR